MYLYLLYSKINYFKILIYFFKENFFANYYKKFDIL